jgi:N-acetyl-gamma-glutamylphosphate reductase
MRRCTPTWYGFTHDQPELLATAVFGLPELHRESEGGDADRDAWMPVTAATLALAPLVEAA